MLHRADLLAELMAGRRGLAVAGAHGKSTTSAMLLAALGDASACVGATVAGGAGTGAVWGAGPWFVAEADESDRSLLRLRPEAAILTNVEHDHHATFASLAEVEEVFRAFLGALPADGPRGDRARPRRARLRRRRPLRRAPGRARARRVGVAEPPPPGAPGFTLALADGRRVPVPLAVPGRPQRGQRRVRAGPGRLVRRAARGGGARGWPASAGVGRRFEPRGEAGGVRVVDDYAHHPTELRATLAAAREAHPGPAGGRVPAPPLLPHPGAGRRARGGARGGRPGRGDGRLPGARGRRPGVSGRLVADAVPRPPGARYAPTLSAPPTPWSPRCARATWC